ncbi:MAG: hypothetical protein E6G47_01720 [Actinobacteria bacterium]|nr:MAG: hypothetical protein E6G47_01720 [Actinomycetota bacterium]
MWLASRPSARSRSTTPSSMSAKRTRWPRSRSARPVARPTTPAPTPRTCSVWTSSSSLMTSGAPARSWVREPIAKPYARTPVPVQGKGLSRPGCSGSGGRSCRGRSAS